MSLAPEFAPEVVIPARARRTARPGAAGVAGGRRGARAQVRALRVAPAAAPLAAPSRAAEAVPSTEWSPATHVRVELPPRPPVVLVLPRAAAPSAAAAKGRPAPSRPADAPLRLTARGAGLLAGVLLGAALAAVAWLSAPSETVGSAGPVPASVTVQPGDTLWSLATELAPDRDPREVMSELRRVNDLQTVALQPGQVLRTR